MKDMLRHSTWGRLKVRLSFSSSLSPFSTLDLSWKFSPASLLRGSAGFGRIAFVSDTPDIHHTDPFTVLTTHYNTVGFKKKFFWKVFQSIIHVVGVNGRDQSRPLASVAAHCCFDVCPNYRTSTVVSSLSSLFSYYRSVKRAISFTRCAVTSAKSIRDAFQVVFWVIKFIWG